MADTSKPMDGNPDQQIWSAITVFERILQTIPDDRVALEALVLAYEQIGDLARACEHLVQLAEVILREGDRTAAESNLPRLLRYRDMHPAVSEVAGRIERLLAAPTAVRAVPETGEPGPLMQVNDVAEDELAFAWMLFEAEQLTSEEYSAIIEDLTELSVTDNPGTLSILHALRDRGSKKIESIMEFAAARAGTPFIPVSAFEVQPALVNLLPMEFVIRQGAVVFEQIGPTLLVALLNPFRQTLRKGIENQLGRTCHFYLTDPSEFEQFLRAVQSRKTTDTADAAATAPAAAQP